MAQPASATPVTAYNLPDPTEKHEISRLNIQHEMWRTSLNGSYIAPIDDSVRTILDIGCGPGSWTRDVASRFPNAHVVGLDIDPPTADTASFPPNVSFVKGNVEDEEVFRSLDAVKFDFVFMRCLVLGIHDWPKHLERCTALLNPGGWLETDDVYLKIFSPDAPLDNTPILRWGNHLFTGCYALGVDPEVGGVGFFNNAFQALGLTNVKQHPASWPFGGLGRYEYATVEQKRFAQLCQTDIIAFMRPVTEKVVNKAPGMKEGEAERLLQAVLGELEATDCPRYCFNVSARCAQKPANDAVSEQ